MSTTASLEPAHFPRRAPGVDLLGPTDAGAHGDHWLVCVDGSRYVQATRRLYLVLLHSDGQTSVDEIARRVSSSLGRRVTADHVRWLLQERLAPAGLVAINPSPGGSSSGHQQGPVQLRTPLLAIRHRLPILPYRLTAPLTDRLHHFYTSPVVVMLIGVAVAVNVWLYSGPDPSAAVRSVLRHPELILVLLLLDLPLRLFHELGHASAMRRAGVPYGEIGVALYVVVPVYYTDVTHSYRLPRMDRVRVDLGGMYFDCISMIGLFLAYRITGFEVLVVAILLVGVNMLREFTPFMRFDGYYLMADLIGVHEPLSLLKPFVLDHLPWRRRRRTLAGLGRVSTVVLAAYFVVVVGFLVRPLFLLAIVGPAPITQFARQGQALLEELIQSWNARDGAQLLTSASELLFWFLVPLGVALFSVGILRILWRGALALVHGLRIRRQGPLVIDARAVDADPGPPPAQPAATTIPPPAHRAPEELRSHHESEREVNEQHFHELLKRAEDAERERDSLRETVRRLEAAFAEHLGDLQALGTGFLDRTERARRELEDAVDPPTSTVRQQVDEQSSDR